MTENACGCRVTDIHCGCVNFLHECSRKVCEHRDRAVDDFAAESNKGEHPIKRSMGRVRRRVLEENSGRTRPEFQHGHPD
jgi:predicted DNA-binding helix-hairpin-helix protein